MPHSACTRCSPVLGTELSASMPSAPTRAGANSHFMKLPLLQYYLERYTSEQLRIIAFPNSQSYLSSNTNHTNGDAPGTNQCERAYFLRYVPGRAENCNYCFHNRFPLSRQSGGLPLQSL